MQLLQLERTLQHELGGGDLELSPENIRKAYGLKIDNFLGFVRQVLELDALPDYPAIVARQFATYITLHNFNADQIRFLTAVQSVFLQKRRLDVADLYEPPLTSFGADAVDKWFSKYEVDEMVKFTRKLQIGNETYGNNVP
jgi:type I restriction enzyme, R subunit